MLTHGRKSWFPQPERIIVGDFNQLSGVLPQETIWAQHGFVEVQRYALEAWNRPIQYTCKKSTTKDFIWVSRELLPFRKDVTLDHDMFADHSVLMAHFSRMSIPTPVNIWKKPVPLPWEEIHTPLSSDDTIDIKNR